MADACPIGGQSQQEVLAGAGRGSKGPPHEQHGALTQRQSDNEAKQTQAQILSHPLLPQASVSPSVNGSVLTAPDC